MGKSQKALLIIFIILLLYFDILLTINSCYSFTFSYAIKIIVKSFIPLAILLVFYFVSTLHVGKLSINIPLLLISLLSFCLSFICQILYYSLIIDKVHQCTSFLYLFALIFLVLAFINSFPEKLKYFRHFGLIVPVILILQFYLSFDYIVGHLFGTYYTNPNRYEFVKYHYFSEEEIPDFPNRIPDDATNVKFYCSPGKGIDSSRTLELEYDSPSVQDNNHHASYNIIIY